MNTNIQRTFRLGALLLLIGVLFGAGMDRDYLALAAPAGAVQRATLPAATCTLAGTTRTCDLWAATGSLSLPGGSTVPIWGYADTATGAASLPGPALIVNQGETVTVNLTNNLAESSALLFQGQAMPPDLTGAAAGGTASYTFVATSPGTFLYEAGLVADAQHQVAMGMFGALIVRPATANQAYDNPASAYDDEVLLVLSEVDPALNNSANPDAFDLRSYKPKYWLINGQAYPDAAPIDIASPAAGRRVLLRYVNAGLQHHAMALLGLDQTLLATDGNPFPYPRTIVAETIVSGQTLDIVTTLPASADAAGGMRYALYDSNLLLHNSASSGFGGMLTFITVSDGPPPTSGPTTSAVTLAPNPTNGQVDVTLSAAITGAAGTTVQAAEYFVDNATGSAGAGLAMTAVDGAFDEQVEDVSVTITVADLSSLPGGDHTFYVHGQDSAGSWGAFNFSVLHLDKVGPTTRSLVLAPNPSNGSVAVALSATGDDSASGNSNITAAEYFVDTAGADGSGAPMTVNVTAPIASLNATIPAGLAAGTHTVSVHSQDAFGQWGAFATIDLIVNQAGPTTSNVTVVPNPNNGSMPINPSQLSVRVDATISAVAGTVKTAEGFIDTVGTDGTGFPFTPVDGLFNSPVEAAYAFIPLTTINTLSDGTHQIWVHGQDASGNWGTAVSADLVIDKTKPVVSNVSATPNPTNVAADNNTSFTLNATATDNLTNITAAEWYDGADPGAGNGTAFTVTPANPVNLSISIDFVALGWTPGNHTLSVRARDSVGYWSDPVSVVVNVVLPNNIFADGFESGNFSAWNGGSTGGVSVTTAAALQGTYGMQAVLAGSNSAGYVTDLTPLADTEYHARFTFNPNGTLTGNNLGQGYTILGGLNSAGTTIFQVQYRRQNQGGGTYQLRLVVQTAGGATTSNWFTVSNATHPVEIAWQSGSSASASLSIDGTLSQTLTGLNTSAFLLDTVRLGPSAGLTNQASGTMFFDSFVSTRRTVIGP